MKLIIFDCDGVLVDSEVLLVDLEIAFLRKHGLDFTTDTYVDQFMGIPVSDWKANISGLLEEIKGESLSEDFFNPLERNISKKLQDELQPVPGAYDTLSALEHTKCVASSSSTKSLEMKLSNTGLFDLFSPHIFSTQLVNNGKPAPDLFLHAASALSAKPVDCVVVEDSVNGVLAGKRAGMQVIGFTGGAQRISLVNTQLILFPRLLDLH